MAETNATADQAGIDSRKEAEAIAGEAKYWQGQLELSHKDHKDFLEEGRTIVQRYKGDKKQTLRANQKRFNILFSNTQTLKAAVFARMAKPDVRRRFADRDPVGKQVAEIIERACMYSQEVGNSEKAFEQAIMDYLLPGRGLVRVCYEAGTATGDDGKEYVADQTVYDKHWPWEDFRHEPGKTWEKVSWEAFRHRMSRDDLHDNFDDSLGEQEVRAIPLNWSPSPDDTKTPDAFKRAEVWEVLDKTKRERVWVVPGYDRVLRKDEDPWNLEGFFPNDEPLPAVQANDTVIPRTEFSTYQDQADGLDEIEARIDRLTKALRRRGVYDATFKELARLSKAADNEFIPVKNYADLTQKGGLAAAFQAEDLAVMAQVLAELHKQRDLRIQTIYEVVGIADIMRGSTDPRETLGAQKIKAQFGGNRLKKRQDQVQKWIRNTLRIKAELIAENFEPQKLAEMTGFKYIPPEMIAQQQAQQQAAYQQAAMMAQQQGKPPPPQPEQPSVDGVITPEMIQILRSDRLRSYRIDIETDSTVFEDAEQEKQAVVELVGAASKFVEAWLPVIQAQPAMLDMAFELLSFALRRFNMGRTLEDVIDQTKMKLQSAASQPKPPDPKVMQEQVKAKAAEQKAALDMQTAQAKHQMELEKMRAEMEKQAAEIQIMFQKMGLEREQMAIEAEHDHRRMAMEQFEQDREMQMREAESAMAADAARQKHEFGLEAMQAKHETGLEMMAQKAKQAKQGPRKNA